MQNALKHTQRTRVVDKICSQVKPEFPRVSVKPRTGPEHPQNTLQ